jgi:2-polyprenyl-6-hydroxyphenyl methylase/3-demethylubiquinone-9 3-methyltransferase
VTDYYARKLTGERLQRVYEIASPRVQRYLDAEIRHVLARLRATGATGTVLELGCGTGRVTERLTEVAERVVGIDVAREGLALAREIRRASRVDPTAADRGASHYLAMDASALGIADGALDGVVCVQNGMCAFRQDQARLLAEALRVTRAGGTLLFSSYADGFWPHRMAWFEDQAAAGLLGPIDREASRDGVIVCRDGFRSGRLTASEFRALCTRAGVAASIGEVDGSCTFCEISRPAELAR